MKRILIVLFAMLLIMGCSGDVDSSEIESDTGSEFEPQDDSGEELPLDEEFELEEGLDEDIPNPDEIEDELGQLEDG